MSHPREKASLSSSGKQMWNLSLWPFAIFPSEQASAISPVELTKIKFVLPRAGWLPAMYGMS